MISQSQRQQSLSKYKLISMPGLACLLCMSISVHSANPVESVELRTPRTTSPHQLPTIQVGGNGNQYTHILTRQLNIPVEISAKCNGRNTLAKSQLGVGKLPIADGHISDTLPPHSEVITTAANQKILPLQKHMFKINLQRNAVFANINPVQACNDFLNKKLQLGMQRSFFMKKDRKMTMRYEISFGAECRRKWKEVGLWRQVSRPVQAIIVCKATR